MLFFSKYTTSKYTTSKNAKHGKERLKPEEKHRKYESQYKKNTLFWGLGIENEVYLELSNPHFIDKTDVLDKQNRERYCLDYYANYKPGVFKPACKTFVDNLSSPIISIPRLINSHSFTKTDLHNEPETLYASEHRKNPLFLGETLFETLRRDNPAFSSEFQKKWLFDGDTIEFNTEQFFNASLQDVMDELSTTKQNFLRELNNALVNLEESCYNNQSVSIMKQNHPIATYMTNLENVAFFNNGTLHYNITLPTELNEYGRIKNWRTFVKDHQKAIRVIQWMEPFLIAMYGSPDPFSFMDEFSKASQRCAVSRYIGIGTYNTDTMRTGKILTCPVDKHICSKINDWWYSTYHQTSGYKPLPEIGMDINFNKHYNHGIELRFFDHIADASGLHDSFEFIIYLMDFILDSDVVNEFGNPILSNVWNKFVVAIMRHGKDYVLDKEERKLYGNIFSGILLSTTAITVREIYAEIYNSLKLKYKGRGRFSKHVLLPTMSISPIQKLISIVHDLVVPNLVVPNPVVPNPVVPNLVVPNPVVPNPVVPNPVVLEPTSRDKKSPCCQIL